MRGIAVDGADQAATVIQPVEQVVKQRKAELSVETAASAVIVVSAFEKIGIRHRRQQDRPRTRVGGHLKMFMHLKGGEPVELDTLRTVKEGFVMNVVIVR